MNSATTHAPSFQELHSNLLNILKTNNKVQEVSSHFGPAHSIENMFLYLWNLDEARQCLSPSLVISKKSDKEAEKFRLDGNKYYQRKVLGKALEHYNQSIMFATHPKLSIPKAQTENLVDDKSLDPNLVESSEASSLNLYETLALGYGNRSAVLYELKLFDKCIEDIEMALSLGCPKALSRKLTERKAKCLLTQGKKTEATKVIETLSQDLADMSVDDDKKKASQQSLDKLLQQASDQNTTSQSLHSTTERVLYRYGNPEPPKLPQPNPTIPCLSSAVKLAYGSTQGRYLVADRDIKPGEVLVVEEGYSKVLHLDSHLQTHCSLCLSRCITPLPCPNCPMVIFCSSACQLKGLASCHVKECSTLSSVSALDIGKNAVLAYRILLQTGFGHLKEMVPVYQKEAASKAPENLGFNDEGLYDSSDYRTIFHLVGNKTSRTVSDLSKRCAMSVVLVKLLEKSQQFFIDPDGVVFSPSQEDILLAGTTMFIHMMNLPCNAHALSELQVNESNYQRSISQEIGCGAFGVLSLTNHSCNPASTRVSYGGVVVLRAIRHIPAGLEVTDSYGEHYIASSGESRRRSLMHQYYFKCVCDPCLYYWPTYDNLPNRIMLKCPQCWKPIQNQKAVCSSCNLTDSSSADGTFGVDIPYNHEEVNKKVILAVKKYEDSFQEVIKGNNSSENRSLLCEVIEVIDKYVVLPCKVYLEAQEVLKHCFDRLGAYNVMNTQ